MCTILYSCPGNFYPRSPCGERRWHWPLPLAPTKHFYPRSPCGERLTATPATQSAGYFYPRSPCGERPVCATLYTRIQGISIHALLAESDLAGPSGPAFLYNFYPRSPCGERRWLRCWQLAARDISIHALLAESDCSSSVCTSSTSISIHALLAESDSALSDFV